MSSVTGCSDPSERAPLAEPVQAEPVQAEPVAKPAARQRLRLFARARRCGECHEKMRGEWQGSAHAKSTHSDAYQRALASLPPAVREECAGCHLPGLPFGQEAGGPQNPSEGVSCDGCHTVSAVHVDDVRATPVYSPESGKRYGPILGASGHYFHDMAYSELHKKSEICAGCHHLMSFTFAGEARTIPVVTDYSGWKRYGRDQSCQDCHMPADGKAPVARGSRARPDVPSHTFPGAMALGKQLRLEVSVDRQGGLVTVELAHSAGHLLPSGYVDRRLIVRATFHDQAGAVVGSQEQAYGVFLEDEKGQPAPFFRAVRVKADRRMIPGKTYASSFKIPEAPETGGTGGGPASKVVISILAARTAPELSAVYGEPDLLVLRSAVHTLSGSRSQGGSP